MESVTTSREKLAWEMTHLKLVEGYYCNSDECAENEYCCGDGICCVSYTVWELWYFWLGIVVFLVMLSTCLCLWKSGFRERILYSKSHSPSYSPLPQKMSHSSNSLSDEYHTADDRFTSSSSDNQASHKMEPPSYVEATSGYTYKLPH
ncbi:hypothetical protein FSP39_013800 [Pinctada imbricata]|uniref:WW domain binding protein VOPP1 n=1 Tax=Pinctada imbricata TaxID=66713 RepID=A0AA89BZD4_PINIB|nr:hypothetical protein FSP39_013800 [Pinctada imbricata]